MNLEPEVVRSITRNRRQVSLHKLVVMMPLALVLALTVFLIIWVRLGPSTTQSNLNTRFNTETDPALLMVFVFRLLPIFLAFYFALRRLLNPARRQYRNLTARASGYDQAALADFKRDLDGVAIGMGVQAPKLVAVAVPTPTAFTFRERGKDYIAVTPALLHEDLSQPEREAVMAHELAHSVDGDYLMEPNAWRGMTGVLFMLAPVVVLLTGILGGISVDKMFAVMVVPSLLLMIGWPLSIWLLVRPYNLNAMKDLSHYSDVLADSVAVKVTSNPDALGSAIVKLQDLVAAAPQMPSESIGFEHMFIGPLKEWPLIQGELLPTVTSLMTRRWTSAPDPLEASMAQSSNRWLRALNKPIGGSSRLMKVLNTPIVGSSGFSPGQYPPAADSEEPPEVPSDTETEPPGTPTKDYSYNQDFSISQPPLGQMESFISWEKELIAERLINLGNIEQNRWQVFDPKSGRAMVKPSSWR